MADLANRIGDLLGFFAITLLFGGVAALAIYHSLKRKPYLIVDAEGLQSPNTGIPLITWYDISEIRRRRDLWRHEYLDLYLQHEDEYIKRLSGTRQRQAKLSRKLGDPVFSLIITSLDVPAEQIYQAIQQHLLSARERA